MTTADTPADLPDDASEPANLAGGLFIGNPDAPALVQAPSDDGAPATAPTAPDLGPDAVSVAPGRPPGSVSAREQFGPGGGGLIDVPGPAAVEEPAPVEAPPATAADSGVPAISDEELARLRARVAEADAREAETRAAAARAAAEAARAASAAAPVGSGESAHPSAPAPAVLAPVAPVAVLEDDAEHGNGLPPELELLSSGRVRLYLDGTVYTLRRPYVGEVEQFMIDAEEVSQATNLLLQRHAQWQADELEGQKQALAEQRIHVPTVEPAEHTPLRIRIAGVQSNREWMEAMIGTLSDKPLGGDPLKRPPWFGNNAVIRDISEHWMANPLDLGA